MALFHLTVSNPITDSLLVDQAWLFVDFFFVLSGFVLAHRYFCDAPVAFPAFLRARMVRLYPLHLYTLGVVVAFEIAKFAVYDAGLVEFRNPPFGENDGEGLVWNLLLLQSFPVDDVLTWNAPSWSISAELWTNLAAAGVFAFFGGGVKRLAVIALLATAVSGVALATTANTLNLSWDGGWLRCGYGLSLGLLVYAAHRVRPLRIASRPLASLLELAVLVAALASVWGYAHLWFPLVPVVFAAVVWVFGAEAGVLSSALRRRGFQFLGETSYSIYLNHAIVAIVFEKAVAIGLGTPSLGVSLALTAAYLGVVCGYSALTYRFIEAPARNWLRAPRRAPAD